MSQQTTQQLLKEIEVLKERNALLEAVNTKLSEKKSNKVKHKELLNHREIYLEALNKAKKILLSTTNLNALQQFVEVLGPTSNASRTYIFLKHTNSKGDVLMSQKAEYSANGIQPQIDNPYLQNMPINIFGDYWRKMLLSGEVIQGKLSNFKQNERDFLQSQNVKAIMVIPIIINNKLLGLIGFDNCIEEVEWDTVEQNFLCSAADDLAQFIEREQTNKLLKNENQRFKATMDALDAVVYVADIETYELIYLNKKAIAAVGNKVGQKCYSTLQQGQTTPCSFCTNHKLLNENGDPKEPYVWEFKNTITKHWYQLNDQAMIWPDGRMVRVEIATDINHQKNAAAKIADSKDFAENLLETANSIILTLDNDAQITSFNKYAEELTGYKKDEVIGKNWFNVFIDERDRIEAIFKNVLSSMPNVSQHENSIITKNGNRRIINWSNSLIYDSEGITKGVLSIGIDVTKQRQTEKTLKESEERYRIIAEQKGQMVYSYNVITGNIEWYGDVHGVTGYDNEEFQHFTVKHWENAIHPDEREIALLLLDNSMKKHERYEMEYRFKSKNGDYKHIEDSGSFLYNNKGEAYLMVGMMKDVSIRKNSEQLAHNSNIQLSATLNALPDLMFEMDNEYRIYDYHSPNVDVLHVKPKQFLGKTIHEIMPPDVANIISDAIDDAYKTGYHSGAVYSLSTKKGEEWFELSISKKEDTHTTKNRFVILVHDITKQKTAEVNLRKERDLFSAGPVCTIVWDYSKNWRVLFVSENIIDLLGYTQAEFTHPDFAFASIIHPDDLNVIDEEVEYYIKNKINSYEQSYRLQKKDGSYCWFYDFNNIIRSDDGQVTEIRGYFFDQTAIRSAEQELESSRERLDLAIKGTNIALWDWKIQTGETVYSEKWAEIIGYTLEELAPVSINTWERFTHPDDLKKSDELLEKHFAGETDYYICEIRMKHKNGSWIWVLDRGKVFEWTKNGKPYRMAGTHLDITKTKKDEQIIIENEKKLRAIIDNTSDAIALHDFDGKMVMINKGFHQRLGYTYTEAMQLTPMDIDTPEYAKKHPDILSKLVKNSSALFETEHKCKDGTILPIEVNAHIVNLNGEKLIMSMGRDISERKKAEIALKNSEENLKSLFNGMTDAVFEIDYNGRYLSVAPTSVPFVYKPNREVINKTFHDIFPKSDANRYLEFIRNCIDNNTSDTLDYTIFINNQIKWFEGRVVPKTKNSVLFIARDITETVRAKLEAKENEARIKALSEATTEAILISENGIIIEVNQAASNLSGYSYDEFIGEYATKFIAKQSREFAEKNMLSGYTKPYDAVVKRKDGSEFYAELQGQMFTYRGEKVRLTAIRDITERKQNELQLQKRKDELKELNDKLTHLVGKEVEKNRKKDHLMIMQSKQAAMGEMISNIAHQWRQPLNEIGLYVQNMQDSYEYNELTLEDMNKTVEKTMNKLDYMSRTIDDFRNFFSAGKAKERFSLSDSVQKSLTLTRDSFKFNFIEVVVNMQNNIYITSYSNEFSQAILNIITNAKDVLLNKKIVNPQIKIDLTKNEKNGVLIISDNGGGIPENIIDKIFDPYFTTKPLLTGTGLGLYISKTIIEKKMLGKLSARNNDAGAEFVIEFALREGER